MASSQIGAEQERACLQSINYSSRAIPLARSGNAMGPCERNISWTQRNDHTLYTKSIKAVQNLMIF